ncbi:MAG: acetoacetate--CoA ligase, partial [Betaproteobacteria bacterium]|nr:acetoacetate--CoA ligase [Betaproteobacteria bacterium]
MSDTPMWTPDAGRAAQSNMARFMARAGGFEDYASLHRWSVERQEEFWNRIWDFCGVIGDKGARTVVDADRMPGARWFPDGRLNFAENLLALRDESDAIVFWGEDKVRRTLTRRQLYDLSSRIAQALAEAGVGKGDRVAGYLPNIPEAVAAMLAATSLGAIWTSSSPDFGVQGVLDRFGQIEPKVLFCGDRYLYGGKEFSSLGKVKEILARLPCVERCIVLPYDGGGARPGDLGGSVLLEDFIAPYAAREMRFERFEFNHPLYIMYSSGTTGVPKCIVHGAGGTLLQHLKEHQLHCDMRPGDRAFYFTTLGWMMWNWLASALASKATICIYDGSPFVSGARVLFDYIDAARITQFGTSAKFIDSLAKAGLKPRETHRLTSMRTLLSTGSPLLPEGFDYVYVHIKPDVCLASMSGGTDLMA